MAHYIFMVPMAYFKVKMINVKNDFNYDGQIAVEACQGLDFKAERQRSGIQHLH